MSGVAFVATLHSAMTMRIIDKRIFQNKIWKINKLLAITADELGPVLKKKNLSSQSTILDEIRVLAPWACSWELKAKQTPTFDHAIK